MPKKISVVVHKLSGDSANLSVDRQATVRDVKFKLSESWGTPPECLRLCLNSVPLADETKIVNACKQQCSTGALSLTSVVDSQGAFACLCNTPSGAERHGALMAVAELAHVDPARAMKVFVEHLNSADARLRCTSLQALAKVIRGEDETASTLAMDVLWAFGNYHRNHLESVDLLVELALAGNSRALACILSISSVLPSEVVLTKEKIAKCLGEILIRVDNPQCVAELQRMTGDDDDRVTKEAKEALSKAAQRVG